ncbi:MAG: PQQ-dependent sugar dehydrogenase [Methylophilaceae bacterium]|nr:PQQ-dependent sugar dehydrogenase [Methylophilaceae bacterium]
MIEIFIYKIKSYFALAMCSIMPSLTCAAEAPTTLNLKLPAGFEANIYAKLDVAPRMMAFSPDGKLLVSSSKSNQVLMLTDANRDGIAEAPTTIASDLNAPNGLAFVEDDLLVANQDGIVKLTNQNNKWSAPTPFISGLATGGHTVKTVKLGPDNHLYFNIGSSCNVCNEADPTRATLLRYTIDGKPSGALAVVGKHTALPPIWASGLRNTQGFAWHPETKAMFATNNGADMRSDSKGGQVNDALPPEHINEIKRGGNYGWPHCWGNQSGGMTTDPNFPGPENFCQQAMPPAIMLTSHSTPIGITFLNKSHFPTEFKGDAIAALHGSWNREQLSGYKLVRVQFKQGKPIKAVDFATGWLNNNQAWGRPVDVVVGPDGALYVSDDRANYIYRITYKQR